VKDETAVSSQDADDDVCDTDTFCSTKLARLR